MHRSCLLINIISKLARECCSMIRGFSAESQTLYSNYAANVNLNHPPSDAKSCSCDQAHFQTQSKHMVCENACSCGLASSESGSNTVKRDHINALNQVAYRLMALYQHEELEVKRPTRF